MELFNRSLGEGIFPNEWKKTQIFPLSKRFPPKSLSDTRPISHLCVVSKVLERIVYNQIMCFLTQNNLISDRQFGYRKGHSTQTALIELVDDIKLGIENGYITILILFDLTKAFDMVNHRILLQKLRALNFSDKSLKWLFSYLSDRSQAVLDEGGTHSDWLKTSCGVPQGSVLGPLLFLLYVNVVPNCVRHGKIIMFVDDTQLYVQCAQSEIDRGIDKIIEDATSFALWTHDNGVQINWNKTIAMIIGSDKRLAKIKTDTCKQIIVDGHHVQFVKEAKNLGIWIDSTLSWDKQVNKTVNKVKLILHYFL